MTFTIQDANTAEIVAGLRDIPADHSVFTSGRIAWERSPSDLAVGDLMRGAYAGERYVALRGS
jgi:hypothetical protein